MATQVMARSGGRRFGPTALAMQSHRAVPGRATLLSDLRPDARPDRERPSGVPVPRQGSGARTAPRRPLGDATRPPMGASAPRRPTDRSTCPPGAAAGGYRMGRWARLSMTVVVTAAIVVGSLTAALRPAEAPTRLVTVQPGDTLLTLVLRDLPDTDPAAAMQQVARLNSLGDGGVEVGTVLRIPAG